MGGTVRLITNQPNLDEFEGKVAGEVSSTTGGGLNYRANGMLNIVTGENSALRLVASRTDRDGYIDRVFDDGAGNAGKVEDVDTEETDTFRAAFRYQLTDNTYIQPTYFYQKTDMDGKPNFDGPSTNPTTQNRRFDAAEPFEDKFEMAGITLSSDFENFSLMVNASKIDRTFTNSEDMTDAIDFLGIPTIFNYGPAPTAAYVDEWVDLEDETFELRLSSASGGNLQWVVGVFSKDAVSQADYNMQRGFEFESPLGLANTRDRSTYDETAIFGEASLDFAESFNFTLGLRALDYSFSQQKSDWGYVYAGAPGLPEDQANFLDVKASDSEVHYRATFSWNAFEAGQVYITSSDATRPGGGNRTIPRSTDPNEAIAFACDQELNALGISGNPSSYGGDSVENLEIGLKMEPSDAWRINAAVYQITWDEIQQRISTSGACGFNPTLNVGEAESTGVEAEVVGALTDSLTLTAGFGYTKSEFTESVPEAGVASGDLIPDVPEFTAAATLDWARPFRTGEIFILGSINYVDDTLEIQGDSNTDVAACCTIDSTNVKPSFTLVNVRVGYVSDSNWQASIFVDNLTDEEAYFSYNDAIVVNVPGFDRTARNRPRTIGVSAQFDF
jgi:outer membrane receptor protein involved in Fe transport